MEEWDHTAKQLKINAELLESVCKDKLTQLYQDKQKARKAYQEEHSKIAAQFNNVSDDFFFFIFIDLNVFGSVWRFFNSLKKS